MFKKSLKVWDNQIIVKKVKKSFQSESFMSSPTQSGIHTIDIDSRFRGNDIRNCPNCELLTLKGMPGGVDAICKNCGYKDPCCSD